MINLERRFSGWGSGWGWDMRCGSAARGGGSSASAQRSERTVGRTAFAGAVCARAESRRPEDHAANANRRVIASPSPSPSPRNVAGARALSTMLLGTALLVSGATAQDAPGKATYDKWCSGCHGVDGTGNGPGSNYMLPRPRNFVQAQYQIRVTASGSLPTDDDILHVIDNGMPGTAMPGWKDALSVAGAAEPGRRTSRRFRTSSRRTSRSSCSSASSRAAAPT